MMADLTPDRLQELRRIAAELRRIAAETTPGTYEWRIIETALALTIKTALALLDRIEEPEQERDAARGEAERWKQQYEELRAGVERVVQDLHERAHATERDWQQSGHPYHDGASDAYYEAARMVRLVRRVLAEAGGGDT